MTASLPGTVGKVSFKTADSFANFTTRVGMGTDNALSQSTYLYSPITRLRTLLDSIYRSSWVIGNAVDVVAEDMTRAGVSIKGTMPPDEMDRMGRALTVMEVSAKINEGIKWGRLYGGALAVLMIDGQDLSTPFDPETVGPGQFKGLHVFDRWDVMPSLNTLVQDYGPEFGHPMFYRVGPDYRLPLNGMIHHSRCVRFSGFPLPRWQRETEQGWGMSVVERIYDRLVAFDSGTMGAGQMLHKSHLRTVRVEGLRQIVAAGGKAEEGLLRMFDMIRYMQTNEGLTLLDKEDEFQTNSFSFAGISDTLLQLGQQLSGATGIPLVRLFGQSPSGLNSSGESDIRNYYDMIGAQQEARLRMPWGKVIDLTYRSEFGRPPPPDLGFVFNPLWQLSAGEKATNAVSIGNVVMSAYESGLIRKETALKELRQASVDTGVFSNITDEELTDAAEVDALPPVVVGADGEPVDESKTDKEDEESPPPA